MSVESVLPGNILPEGFLLGAAVASFQVEGGLNGPGEPANNWKDWEATGRVWRKEPSGIGVDFWNRYEEYFDLAKQAGCNALRFGIEWARVEPQRGQFDKEAIDHYAEMLKQCRNRGIQPLITLSHWTHPYWCGEKLWLSDESPEIFSSYVSKIVPALQDYSSHWVTINEMNALTMLSYLFGAFPPGLHSPPRAAVASGHMLEAHIRAYEAIHATQPGAMVTTNNWSTSIYELDRLFIDLLSARRAGVSREDVDSWIAQRRDEWYSTIGFPPKGRIQERLLRSLSAAQSPAGKPMGRAGRLTRIAVSGNGEGTNRVLDAVYSSPYEITLDMVGIDYYTPLLSDRLVLPGHRETGGRGWLPTRMMWDDPVDPHGLVDYIRANQTAGIPVWIVENGLCNRIVRGHAYNRIDGWNRPGYLREILKALVEAVDSGLLVGGYFHWSLVDNYEWGSYQPRFGIYGVDRERGIKLLPTDSMGMDSAAAFKKMYEGLLKGDRSVLA